MSKNTDVIRLPIVPHQEVLRKTIDEHGTEYQVDILIEEMSELTQALLKYRRAALNDAMDENYRFTNLCEETADVIIGLTELLMIHDCKKEVQSWIDVKTERLM